MLDNNTMMREYNVVRCDRPCDDDDVDNSDSQMDCVADQRPCYGLPTIDENGASHWHGIHFLQMQTVMVVAAAAVVVVVAAVMGCEPKLPQMPLPRLPRHPIDPMDAGRSILRM